MTEPGQLLIDLERLARHCGMAIGIAEGLLDVLERAHGGDLTVVTAPGVPDLIERTRAKLAELKQGRGSCARCGAPKEGWQVYCGAACTTKAEAGE